MRIKHIFARKVLHMASFWKWRVLELGSGLNYRAVPVIHEKAFKILHKVALGMVFIKKLAWKYMILDSIVMILLSDLSCLEFVYYLFIYHYFWKYKVWNLFAFYLNSNIQNFFTLTKTICQTPHFFLFCFKWAVVIMMMIILFMSQTSSLAQVLKLIGDTYYDSSILINFWFLNNFPIKRF